MLVIRFARFGRNKQAFFRLVAAEKARPVKKKFIEKLGYYNPHANGGEGEFIFEADKIKKHIANGAQLSQTAARLLTKAGLKEAGKFVEQRVTKPKKEEQKPEPKEENVEEGIENSVEEKEAETTPEVDEKSEEAAPEEEKTEEPKEEVAEEKKED